MACAFCCVSAQLRNGDWHKYGRLQRKFRVGLVQMSCGPDPDANLEKAAERVREAARLGADVVCLPELFRAQYFCQREDIALFDLAEPIPGPSTERLGAVAREENVVVDCVAVRAARAGACITTRRRFWKGMGALRALYRKMHIPDDPLYYEKFYFTPGDLGFRAFDTSAGKIGTLVCWDQWYPEGARITALQGANVLFYPDGDWMASAEKEEFGAAQYDAWQTIQRAHAIANGVYVAAVNRVGMEHGDVRGNRAEGPGLGVLGRIVSGRSVWARDCERQRTTSEEILMGEIDLAQMEDTRRNWPFLRDRRIDAYAPIVNRFLDRRRANETRSRSPNDKGKTPRELGYRMPAEWEPHEATWLAWPHNPEDWPGKFQPIPWVYAEIVRHWRSVEEVHILVNDAAAEKRCARHSETNGANLGQVHFHLWPTDRVWTRDSGPIFVRKRAQNRDSTVAVTNWKFNAWAKYHDWHLDDKIPGRVAELSGFAAMAAHRRDGGWSASRGSGRRIDRCQRRGDTDHHRRVPAERGAAAQSWREPRATGAGFPRLSGNRPGALDEPRHCRRRHARTCGRHHALCRTEYDCDRG